MKSSKQPKGKVEQASIQRSISKGPTGGKKSGKSPLGAGQHQIRAVGKDSTLCRVPSQQGDCYADKGSSLEVVNQMPSDIKLANPKRLYSAPKIKLQLFPVTEKIQMGLEKDGHNPFLELTLSTKKKISSVLKHLFNKWGSSSIATGELVLFPLNITAENLNSCRRWTSSDVGITAGDVHAELGSPKIFRLRYGWVSSQPNIAPSRCTEPSHVENVYSSTMYDISGTRNEVDGTSKELEPCRENEVTDVAVRQPVLSESLHQAIHNNQDEVKSEDFKPSRSSQIDNDAAVEEDPSTEPFKDEEPRMDTGLSMTSLLWSDLSNISIGGFLSEISRQGRFNIEDPRSGGSRSVSKNTVSDSLDAFIEQFEYPHASTTVSPDMPSSILDAESTCHSFAFSKPSSSSKDLPTLGRRAFSGLSDHSAASEPFNSPKSEVNAQGGLIGSNSVQEPKTVSLAGTLGAFNNENSLGLSSIRWNDSLGPFDLPLSSRQIIKDDNISIGGFVR